VLHLRLEGTQRGKKASKMIMFVTGEGGTGKSFLISLIMELANLTHGKQKGSYGSAMALAPTRAGYTWQSVYGKGIAEGKGKKWHPDQQKQ
jgi:nucleoside-triphosphatase THEP1